MKRILLTASFIVTCIAVSCTNLDEEMYNVIPQDQFGKTEREINSLIGPAYGTICEYVDGYFWYGMCAGDDFIIPSRGFDWNSGGVYRHTHEHTFSATEANNIYNFWRFQSVTTINKVLALVQDPTKQIADRERIVAELRGLRAWWYFFMLDRIGPVPIVTKFDNKLPTNEGVSRKDVYDFVEEELKDVIDDLSEEVSMSTYGKVTKWVAYSLLAKLYLNAEVYTGKAKWREAQECCQKIIDSQKFILEPDNNTNFLVHNEVSRENIFSIPYNSEYFICYFIPYQLSWHMNNINSFNIRFSCWNGPCFTPSFMKSYDPDDKRLGWFLYGQQYDKEGNPLYDRKGNLLNFTFDFAGGDYANANECDGARMFKWELENDSDVHLNNDFAIFRYVDILLMKAECLLRQDNEEDARDIVNECRARNFDNYDESKQIQTLTLDELLAERGRELVCEGWRRNDLIRFGKYTGSFDFKPNKDNTDNHTLLFPIPQQVIDSNSKIKQNPGY